MRTMALAAVICVIVLTAWSMSMLPRPNDTMPRMQRLHGEPLLKPHMAISR
jgi:hypothetical protein